jgi:ferric-dicitrate binding protein FerR (iron transport regulator)
LTFDEEIPDESYIHEKYLQHLKQVKTKPPANIFNPGAKAIRRAASLAAVLVGIIVVTSLAYFFFYKNVGNEKMTVATRYGENKKVLLPDGSGIILNAHSTVQFAKDWNGNKPREIWLKGEAFIDVNHVNKNKNNIKLNERFLVHGEDFTIEVLGTSFNIRQRRGKTEIVLQTGRIKLMLKDNPDPIILIPGDLVSYIPESNTVIKTRTNPENYSGWKEKKLLLNNPTLEEIVNYLEDNYGKDIVIENDILKKKQIEGIILLSNLNDAMFIISTVLNTDIIRKGDVILIRSK